MTKEEFDHWERTMSGYSRAVSTRIVEARQVFYAKAMEVPS